MSHLRQTNDATYLTQSTLISGNTSWRLALASRTIVKKDFVLSRFWRKIPVIPHFVMKIFEDR